MYSFLLYVPKPGQHFHAAQLQLRRPKQAFGLGERAIIEVNMTNQSFNDQ